MKKFFEYMGLIGLVCFSFFLTDKTVSVVQEVDEIMVQIKEHQIEYKQDGKDATITGKNIIPGLPNKSVNVEKSYQEMKKLGVYDSNYFVYDVVKPKENLDNHLDKYVVSGNAEKRMVSLIFILNDSSISSILDIIGDRPVSFILPNYNFQNQSSNVELAIERGNDFLIGEEQEQQFLSLKQKLETLNNPANICYNPNQNDSFLSLCGKNGYYSVASSNIIGKTPLTMAKEYLKPGAILTFEVNKQLLTELPNIISYIESRGYTIASLSTHLKED